MHEIDRKLDNNASPVFEKNGTNSHDQIEATKVINESVFNPTTLDLNKLSNRINENRRIAGIWKQFSILTWKNLILSRRNACGLVTEILCPLIVILILIVIRYFVDVTQYEDQANASNNVLDLLPITPNSTSNASLLLYYPNTPIVYNIITNAVSLIKLRKPYFNASSKILFCIKF